MLQLALPVVLTYFGLMTMGFVDLICVGRIGPAAIGAVGMGTSIFGWFMIFGIGILTGLEFLIAHAFGAKNHEECHQAWVQGMWISLGLGIPLTAALLFAASHLEVLGADPEVVILSQGYLRILAYSLIPVFIFTAARIYLQAMGSAKPALWILIMANLLNASVNWVLIFGHCGFHAMGVAGSAVATLLARVFMTVAMLGCLAYHDHKNHQHLLRLGAPFHLGQMLRLLKLGIPSAFQMTFEVGVFALSTLLAARLTADSLAAHQIVLNVASLTFMVPLGLGSATAVLVGQELGRKKPIQAAQIGWKGWRIGVAIMSLSALGFILFKKGIVSIYTNDASVALLAMKVLMIAALFQLSDGAQTVATGALRGLGDTRTPMLANLVGHWAIGLPIGVLLCFWFHYDLVGLWIGLSIGLTSVAILLTWRWSFLSKKVAATASESHIALRI